MVRHIAEIGLVARGLDEFDGFLGDEALVLAASSCRIAVARGLEGDIESLLGWLGVSAAEMPFPEDRRVVALAFEDFGDRLLARDEGGFDAGLKEFLAGGVWAAG